MFFCYFLANPDSKLFRPDQENERLQLPVKKITYAKH